MFQEYFLTYHKEELTKVLTSAPEEVKHLPLNINFVKLFENDPKLGNMILKDPEKTLESLDKALVNIQKILSLTLNTTEILEKIVHTRVYGLPSCHDQHRISIPRSADMYLFLQINGSVVRTTLVKMLEFRRYYKCSKCKYQMTVNATYEQKYIIFPPKKCLNPEGCGSSNIIAINCLDANNCKDFQEIKIQEQVSKSSLGSMPRSMWITLEDDLVDVCKPGDNITVCGILKSRWEPLIVNKKISAELVLKANHLQVNNAQCSSILVTPDIKNFFHSFWKKYKNEPLLGRDIIIKSMCPQIYGLHTVKLAVGMVLASGSRMQDIQETGLRVRSESHLLLVGDPGTGKSQILKFAAKIIPRSVLTTGIGSTSAGLTVTAFQENGEWQLEGGALVLADGGICCIDEFNSMKERDRTSIHEAMEQQTISVAKASIVCKLSTRCSILAAINPKGNFDLEQPLSVNVGLPSPLLSRFDIILILKDTIDAKWDEVVCDHIIDQIKKGGGNDPGIWEIDLLRAYFSYIKDIQPKLTLEANKILANYYQAQRRSFAKNRVTVRLLDSLVRLSKAHARLMFHTEVHVVDAVNAVIMMESSMHAAILGLNVNSLHSPFPKDPMQCYNQLARSILEKLELLNILNYELIQLTKLAEQKTAESDSSVSFEREAGENTRILSRLHHKYEKIKIKHCESYKNNGNNDDVTQNEINVSEYEQVNLFEHNNSDEEKRNQCDLVFIKTVGDVNDKVVENEYFVRDKSESKLSEKNVLKKHQDVAIKDTDNTTNNSDKHANKLCLQEDTRKQIGNNKQVSVNINTRDFLSKFKFTKRNSNEDENLKTAALKPIAENKSTSIVMESNDLQNKSSDVSKEYKNEGTNKENNNEFMSYKKKSSKRKINNDDPRTYKNKKVKAECFYSEIEIDIENDIEWDLGEIVKEEEVPNIQILPSSETIKKNAITSQVLSGGLFEFEDDNIKDWDL